MTSRDDLERAFYRAITNNRLGRATHTVANALKALSRFKQPWTVAGVSRETWRRWNLKEGAQKPKPKNETHLLAVLRRLRLSDSREARMRASGGIHVTATDNYEDQERNLGSTSFDWSADQTTRTINDVLDAYLVGGIGPAVDRWLEAAPKDGGWAAEWLHPDSHGSSQSMGLHSIDLTGDPARAGRARRR